MPVGNALNSETFKVTTPTDVAITISRVFDAPRHLVFEALTKPEHIRQWWGMLGEGYSVPVCEVDLRVGGKWKFSSKTPKGELVTFYGTYREIKPPDKLVYTEIYEVYPDTVSECVTTLTEQKGKTMLTVTASYPSREVRDMVMSSGMEYGAALGYDRMEEILAKLKARG
jgi:uncharacterized protein YndB with AHSA1/START domain